MTSPTVYTINRDLTNCIDYKSWPHQLHTKCFVTSPRVSLARSLLHTVVHIINTRGTRYYNDFFFFFFGSAIFHSATTRWQWSKSRTVCRALQTMTRVHHKRTFSVVLLTGSSEGMLEVGLHFPRCFPGVSLSCMTSEPWEKNVAGSMVNVHFCLSHLWPSPRGSPPGAHMWRLCR